SSPSSSYSGGSRSYRSSGYSSSGGYSSSYGGGGGCDSSSPTLLILLLGGAVIAVVIRAAMTSTSGGSAYSFSSGADPYVSFEGVDVSVLRVAVDGRARKFIQTELARIAKAADTATEEGRLSMLREVSLLLRRVRDAWVYG